MRLTTAWSGYALRALGVSSLAPLVMVTAVCAFVFVGGVNNVQSLDQAIDGPLIPFEDVPSPPVTHNEVPVAPVANETTIATTSTSRGAGAVRAPAATTATTSAPLASVTPTPAATAPPTPATTSPPTTVTIIPNGTVPPRREIPTPLEDLLKNKKKNSSASVATDLPGVVSAITGPLLGGGLSYGK